MSEFGPENAPIWVLCDQCRGKGYEPFPRDFFWCRECGGRGGFFATRQVAKARYSSATPSDPEADV
jgi:DnaJ-class molecular chaperone